MLYEKDVCCPAAAARAEEASAPEPGGGAGAAGDEAAVGRVPRVGHRDDRHQGRKVSELEDLLKY